MSIARHHNEWLSLVETSGPFVSVPVLMRVFPQGLDSRDPDKARELKLAYDEWRQKMSENGHHHAWVKFVLERMLEFPKGLLAEGQSMPPGMEAVFAEYNESIRPDIAIVGPKGTPAAGKPHLLVNVFSPGQALDKPAAGKLWKASPATRMMELLHALDIPLGLVTNGEDWMLVYAPRGETTGFTTWNADIWQEEHITLRSFHSLLHCRRFFGVADKDTLEAMLKESALDQQEVTDQLGYQVRRAVEVLVQAVDRLDQDSGRKPLQGFSEQLLYDSALTVMMRIVFLFSAEERGLLRLGDPLYDDNYAISTLREQLRETADQYGEEVLERRCDAWCRLLATFRAVHAGVEHESMRLPPYGGTLFDPDRYPFLEGRQRDTKWRTAPANPLAINNRVVLHLLEALQILRVKVPGGGPAEARRLSFRSLDIEQIGHIYEGLLDHTAVRANEVVLGITGTREKEPEIPISKLEELAGILSVSSADKPDVPEPFLLAAETPDNVVSLPTATTKVNYGPPEKLIEVLKDETGRSPATLKKLLSPSPEEGRAKQGKRGKIQNPSRISDDALLIACGHDRRLFDRLSRFAGLIREDDFGRPIVIHPGSVFVTAGTQRRSTGTHYTPRSLTEPIVQHTLEPLVYTGPAEGKPKTEWKLKLPREILALKVCDMTMGSGAFLVQTCRYLAERLVEAWEIAENKNPGKLLATPEGDFSTGDAQERLIPKEPAERLAIARRYVADRCLYGVDINPMAVEMAKLSLWLITLQRDRPFTFLDHALKCGDSLLGVSSVQQIENFSLRPGDRQVTFATANLFRYVDEASAKRRALEDLPSNDHTQIETKNRLHAEAEAATAKVKALADCLIAFELRGLDGDAYEDQRTDEAEKVQLLMKRDADASLKSQTPTINQLSAHAREQLRGRRPFHWSVEFPEVFGPGGFDAFVGNPPYLGGTRISTSFGSDYYKCLQMCFHTFRNRADLCSLFFLRANALTNTTGFYGLLATNTIAQGDTRAAGLDSILESGSQIYFAIQTMTWPGTAGVFVSVVHISKSPNSLETTLDGKTVSHISAYLDSSDSVRQPQRLAETSGKSFAGSKLDGIGFALETREATELLANNAINSEVIFPYLIGQDLNTHPEQRPSRYVINFFDWPEEKAAGYKDCYDIIRERVYPGRQKHSEKRTRDNWWLFQRLRSELYETIHPLRRVLVIALTSNTVAFVFVPQGWVYSHSVIVLAFENGGAFGLLQSSFHNIWTRTFGSTMKGDQCYIPTDCFENFPFPNLIKCLDAIGDSYHELRHQIMLSRQEGLTKTYNRFHDRGEQSADIARLRALHVEMDQAVAAAYGWSDLDLGHGFHPTKQGERYTLSESARRTVLDRLLALNHQRYAEEVKAGLHEKKKSKTKREPKTVTPLAPATMELDFTTPKPAKPMTEAVFASTLIIGLLSESLRQKTPLRMSQLNQAFNFVTRPATMEAAAPNATRGTVKAWVAKWQSPAGPDFFIPTMRLLKGGTVRATTDEDDPPIALVGKPNQPDSPELQEGIRLAVQVVRSARPLPPAEMKTLIRERRSIFTTV